MMLHQILAPAFGGSDSFNDWRQVRPSHILVAATGTVAVGY